jgi:hypothetical protein
VTDGLLAGAEASVDAGRRLGSGDRTERSLAPFEVLLSIVAILATDLLVKHASRYGIRLNAVPATPNIVAHWPHLGVLYSRGYDNCRALHQAKFWVSKGWKIAAQVRLVRESDQVMGNTEVSRATLYRARPPKRHEKAIAIQFVRWWLGVGQELVRITAVSTMAVILYAPPALALIAGGIACASCVFWLVQIQQAYSAGQYDVILSDLPALSFAATIAFASLAYLALLYGFSVLIAGLIGHRRQHLYVIPGSMLSFSALLVFTTAAYLLIPEIAADTGWGTTPFVILFSCIGVNVAVLGLLVTDLRPPRVARKARSVLLHHRALASGHRRITTVGAPPEQDDGPTLELPVIGVDLAAKSRDSTDLCAAYPSSDSHRVD